MDKRLSVRDNGSNYPMNDRIEKGNTPRSVFDLSYLNTFTADMGVLYPVMTAHSLPKEDNNFGLEAVLRVVNPPTVPLLSKQRVYFHTFWCSYSQLWKEAKMFFDKGHLTMTPPDSVVLPTFDYRVFVSSPSPLSSSAVCRGSLADMLGFNFSSYEAPNYIQTLTLPALKFMMYLKIWRDYYCNKRIFSAYLRSFSDSSWQRKIGEFLFPVDDEDFRIGSSQWDDVVADEDCINFLLSLKFRDWTDDYFTTMQITPLYVDDAPSLDIDVNLENLRINSTALFDNGANEVGQLYSNGYNASYSGNTRSDVVGALYLDGEGPALGIANLNPMSGTYAFHGSSDSQYNGGLASALNRSLNIDITNVINSSGVNANGQVTIDKLRECMAETLILEKMAKTDGTYGEFVYTMYGEKPKSAVDMRPTYVGGTYQPIVYSQVLSNIPTTQDSTVRPQGTATGVGLSSADGFIGSHHSDDYGLYMTIMSIMPDTYYCQGWQREDLYQTSDDYFLPERAGLGMQAVLSDEIYYDGDSVLLGYQNRYDELRFRNNEVHGKVADNSNNSFSPYIQTRYFNSKPTLSPEFLSTENNIPKKWLSSQSEVPFIVQLANKIRSVRPVPYFAKPSDFGM